MKIDDRPTAANPSAAGVRNDPQAKPTAGRPEKNGLKPDTIELSSRARQIQRAQEALRTLPDIRTDKVDAIKSRIRNGTYTVDSEKIAAKMIEDAILNKP